MAKKKAKARTRKARPKPTGPNWPIRLVIPRDAKPPDFGRMYDNERDASQIELPRPQECPDDE